LFGTQRLLREHSVDIKDEPSDGDEVEGPARPGSSTNEELEEEGKNFLVRASSIFGTQKPQHQNNAADVSPSRRAGSLGDLPLSITKALPATSQKPTKAISSSSLAPSSTERRRAKVSVDSLSNSPLQVIPLETGRLAAPQNHRSESPGRELPIEDLSELGSTQITQIPDARKRKRKQVVPPPTTRMTRARSRSASVEPEPPLPSRTRSKGKGRADPLVRHLDEPELLGPVAEADEGSPHRDITDDGEEARAIEEDLATTDSDILSGGVSSLLNTGVATVSRQESDGDDEVVSVSSESVSDLDSDDQETYGNLFYNERLKGGYELD
jgi:hypothetical protein